MCDDSDIKERRKKNLNLVSIDEIYNLKKDLICGC
jgi:hypothetical protein